MPRKSKEEINNIIHSQNTWKTIKMFNNPTDEMAERKSNDFDEIDLSDFSNSDMDTV